MTAEQLAAIERIRAYKPPFYKWMNYDPADAIALLDALDAAQQRIAALLAGSETSARQVASLLDRIAALEAAVLEYLHSGELFAAVGKLLYEDAYCQADDQITSTDIVTFYHEWKKAQAALKGKGTR
jgi:hypothetical protein